MDAKYKGFTAFDLPNYKYQWTGENVCFCHLKSIAH